VSIWLKIVNILKGILSNPPPYFLGLTVKNKNIMDVWNNNQQKQCVIISIEV
jgi:hypothetical protein